MVGLDVKGCNPRGRQHRNGFDTDFPCLADTEIRTRESIYECLPDTSKRCTDLRPSQDPADLRWEMFLLITGHTRLHTEQVGAAEMLDYSSWYIYTSTLLVVWSCNSECMLSCRNISSSSRNGSLTTTLCAHQDISRFQRSSRRRDLWT